MIRRIATGVVALVFLGLLGFSLFAWRAAIAPIAGSRGRVAGRSGAAAMLGVPPSTLDHRIKALDTDKAQFKFR